MAFFKFIEKLFPKPTTSGEILNIYYRCHKCKHAFKLTLNRRYDIQPNYEENSDFAYLYQKELRDPKCFNTIKFKIYFDPRFNILNHEIHGGEIISEEEFLQDNLDKS